MTKENKPLWIFVDETGTSSLEDKSNPIFGLGFLASSDPVLISQILTEIKYKVWLKTDFKDTVISSFHASKSNNPKWVKNLFYEGLFRAFENSTFFENFSFSFITKKQVGNYLKNNSKNVTFYLEFHKFWLIQTYFFLIHNYFTNFSLLKKHHKINLVLSKIFNRKEEKMIYKNLKENLPKIDLEIYWVENKTDYACQLADYFSWTTNRFILKNDKKEAIGFSFLEKSERLKIMNTTEIFCQDYLLNQITFFDSLNEDKNPKNGRKLEEILSNLTKQNNPPIKSSFRRET